MRLHVRIFGLDLLDVELVTEPSCDGLEDDCARDLSGGNLGAFAARQMHHPDCTRWVNAHRQIDALLTDWQRADA